mmetsp:Transcript_36541/g.68065  ORF Transcript_36541/g.68065 Transcript_36541/m.68065 type:complete len:240 (-) Transcript_36541:76-795(-)
MNVVMKQFDSHMSLSSSPKDDCVRSGDVHVAANNKSKRLIFIRHAESQNNVDKREARLAWKNIKTAEGCPTFSQICSAGRLLTVPMNSDLSSEGEMMVKELRKKLLDINFIMSQKVEVVIHSPLLRAKRTCYTLFSSDDDSDHNIVPIIENTYIYEKNIPEALSISDINIRVDAFREYIRKRDEKCIVIVGHSAFFRAFLGTHIGMKNCEVGVVEVTETGECSSSLETLIEGGHALLSS